MTQIRFPNLSTGDVISNELFVIKSTTLWCLINVGGMRNLKIFDKRVGGGGDIATIYAYNKLENVY